MAQPNPYRERLSLSWWLWLPAVAVAAALAAEVKLGAPGAATWVAYLVLLPLTVAGLWLLGRIRIEVSNGELRVDDAHIPLRYVGEVTPLSATDKRDLMGPYSDPEAFVVQRPWIGGAVRLEVRDEADPTPYWLVSTRRPEALAEALREAQASITR
ncbi:DUF3093 domain-containing protein [Dactylosporangium sp. NPDC048998]|uniref:DUF3093 domain-containing protein n=1 Tax=Dactylosporangium sp. NPDC048998 TaxID=3363976 RepID=UPI00371A84DF